MHEIASILHLHISVIVGQFVPQMATWKVRNGGKHLLCPLISRYVYLSDMEVDKRVRNRAHTKWRELVDEDFARFPPYLFASYRP